MIRREELEREWSTGNPKPGVLYVAYFPVGDTYDGVTFGHIAMAYFRTGEGWVYADTPIPLKFEPFWFKPWEDLLK